MENKQTEEERIAGDQLVKEILADDQAVHNKILENQAKKIEVMKKETIDFTNRSLGKIFILHHHLEDLKKLQLFVYRRGIVGMSFIWSLLTRKGAKPS